MYYYCRDICGHISNVTFFGLEIAELGQLRDRSFLWSGISEELPDFRLKEIPGSNSVWQRAPILGHVIRDPNGPLGGRGLEKTEHGEDPLSVISDVGHDPVCVTLRQETIQISTPFPLVLSGLDVIWA